MATLLHDIRVKVLACGKVVLARGKERGKGIACQCGKTRTADKILTDEVLEGAPRLQ